MKKERTEKNIQTHRKNDKKHGNKIISGAWRAFLGAAAGGVLWVGLGQSRSLSALRFVAGAVAVIAAFKGYHLLGGRRCFFGSVFCGVLSLGVLCLAEMMDWGVFLYRRYHHDYDIGFWDAFQAIPDAIKENPESLKIFARDLLAGFVAGGAFILWGIQGENRSDTGAKKE